MAETPDPRSLEGRLREYALRTGDASGRSKREAELEYGKRHNPIMAARLAQEHPNGLPEGHPAAAPAAGAKRAAGEGDEGGDDEDDDEDDDDNGQGVDPEAVKRNKRLEKNRESARLCRKRKKAYVQAVEEKVQDLSSQIASLQREYWYTKEQLQDERRKVATELETMVKTEGSDQTIAPVLSKFSRICYTEGQDAIAYHFEQMKALLIPAQQFKFILWGLDQNDEFYRTEKGELGGNIWTLLSEEMGWSKEQVEWLQNHRESVRLQNKDLTDTMHQLEAVKSEILHRLDSLHQNMRSVYQHLTPSQQAKFVVWVEQNQAAMRMLNVLAGPNGPASQSSGGDRPPQRGGVVPATLPL